MTDKQKLQQLFEAALKEPSPANGGPPKRAFPETSTPLPAVPHEAPFLKPAPAVSMDVVLPDRKTVQPKTGPGAPVLDDKASDNLDKMLDGQISRQSRKRKRLALTAALVLFGLTGGGLGWFVHSPERVQAFTSAMREIRSVTDMAGIVAKYQASLDKIAGRAQQIDQATAAMGDIKTAADDMDPNREAEMQQPMGGEGKTVGGRNRTLQASFGNRAEENNGALKPTAAIAQEDSFQFTH